MTESEFLNVSDALFERIQSALDAAGAEVESLLQGNVLELEFDDGSKVIVNRHVPNSEMWLAGKSGGFHFRQDAGGNWLDTRDGGEFFARLAAMISQQSGQAFCF